MRIKKLHTSATSHAAHAVPTPESGWTSEQIQAAQRTIAESLRREVVFRDVLKDGTSGPEMLVIPPGTFLMGSPPHEKDRLQDETQHLVTIQKPFAMGRYAVTFAEYEAFCGATGQKIPQDMGWGRARRPVINVTWNDALDYCEWLYEQTGHSYWLPTEAEWEYACRAGTITPFAFGMSISLDQVQHDDDRMKKSSHLPEHHGDPAIHKTKEVGSFPANALGLYEMHGNVWEWTCSEYEKEYNRAAQECSHSKRDFGLRVYRGGSWFNKSPWVRSAARSHRSPSYHYDNLGFRLTMML